MNTLTNPGIPQRPDWRNNDVLKSAAEELVKDYDGAGPLTQTDVESLIAALRVNGPSFDAYHVAKTLEDDYAWACDTNTVNWLESAWSIVLQSVWEATHEWVKTLNIVPQRQIGDPVTIKQRRGELVQGEIVKINTELASYTVFSEQLGHVRSGNGVLGLSVNFEDIHELAPPPEEFQLAFSS